MAVPNATVSVARLEATLATELEVVGGPGVSRATGTVLGAVAAVTAGCPGAESVEAGAAGSVLTSGTAGAAGVASAPGATRLELDAAEPGLLTAGCTRAASFFPESEVCRGAGGSGAAWCCPRSEAVDAEASLLSGFSGEAEDVASSVLLPEDTGRVGADAELRRLPNDKVGNEVGRGAAVVADGGADGGTVLLVCWLPKEKLVLLPLGAIPLKPITPEDAALVRGRPPKMPVEELLALGLAPAGAPVPVVTEEVTGGSACFPNTGGPVKLNPEGTVEVLVSCALVRLVDEALMAGFVESSAWPTRSPEKLPRVSPAKELGNRSSPNLDGGVSSLLEELERATPEGAAGRLLEGAGSAGEAPVLGGAVIPDGGELSATGS